MASPALEIRGLSKSFGGALALDNVDLTVARGEVHGLLGHNGSGKSTLIKVLSGFHAPEPGATLRLFGRPVALPLAPGQFRELGLGFVHQHLGVIPSLSVLENMRLSEFATRRAWRIDWRAEARAVAEALGAYGVDLDPAARVADLAQVDRCLLAIVRAMEEVRVSQEGHGGEGILVLDEPTPFLNREGVDRLFALVRQVAARGAAVIFVSHDVDEITEITDRATVLRDGRVAGTLETARAAREEFIEMIVGKRISPYVSHHAAPPAEAAQIAITGLTGSVCRNVDLALAPGEVVGLTGLIGSGFDELPALVFGARAASAGRLSIDGVTHDLPAMTPRAALEAGIAYLPADRLGASGAGSLSVTDNMTLPSLRRFLRPLGLDRPGMQSWTADTGARHAVRPNRPGLPLEALSGGNQQKVLLAKWLETAPRLLLLDEPTQGVDVGARQQVFAAIDAAAELGMAVLCASTDAEQLAQICDRVIIFGRGEIAATLSGPSLSKEEIASRCYTTLGTTATALSA